MPNYKNGKVYGIYHNGILVYIGSTTQVLAKRMTGHRNDAKRKDTAFYKYYNENNSKDFQIILIENYTCDTKEQLFRREAELQRENPSTYNSRLPYKTDEEWELYKLELKEYMCNYNKNYRNKDIEKTREEENKRSKEYAKNNRKLRNEIQRKSNLKTRYKIQCDCGSEFYNQSKWQHEKSEKHLNYIATKV